MTRKKKRKFQEIEWNKKKVRVFFTKLGWEVVPLENQYISQDEKIQIVRGFLNAVEMS